jgi:hypothetical protein
MITRLFRVSLVLALVSFLAAPQVFAQAPKLGNFYKDSVEFGFRVKMPKGWAFTPPQPGENNLIGKYTPPFNSYINISPETVLWLEAYLLKFDSRQETDEDGEVTTDEDGNVVIEIDMNRGSADLESWIDRRMRGSGFRVKETKDIKIRKVEATQTLFVGQKSGVDFHVYTMVYHLEPKLDVALVFNGPADKKKWRKYEMAFNKMAKSFGRIDLKELAFSETKEDDSPARSQKRGELEAECAKNPGWELYETKNYFVITDNDDRQFMKELMDRLEAIREVYEELYPWKEAERLRLVAANARKKKAEEEGEDPEAEEKIKVKIKGQGRTSTNISSRELSRCSVVRIFKNKTQYHEYGGPGGSAGYWASFHEELVIYDDKSGGGRRDTWAVLNHEAFHQYIFYLYGSLSPHSWYNEGTGDYFSGYKYKHKRFKLKPFEWRVETIKTAIKANKHVPLKDLVRFSQREYYGNNKFGVGGGQNYAQGWSLIYFLRTGKGKAPNWNNNWNKILDIYFATLASTEDLDAAVDAAFAGVDWNALEESWKSYTLKGK